MNRFDFSNLDRLTASIELLKPENFYLQGNRAKEGGMIWSVQYKEHPKWIAFCELFNSLYPHSSVIQGKNFFNLAYAAANEQEEDSFVDLTCNVHFAHFCRKLEGIETLKHRQQRSAQMKEKLLRAVEKAKILTKGLAQHPQAKMLDESTWLEALSPDHCYAFDLHKEWIRWQKVTTSLSFNEWREKEGLVGTHSRQVKYLNAAERKQYEVCMEEGRLRRNGKPFDTSTEETLFSGRGIGIFVVSLEDNWYVGSHRKGYFHHSSFLSGAPVKGAGEIQTNSEGEIVYLSTNSGHYNPGKKELLVVLEILQKKGVCLEIIKLRVSDEKGEFYYQNAEHFLLAKGNLLPDGIEQATFERDERGDIKVIHQHALRVSSSNNRDLLASLKGQGVDFSQVIFKEETLWGDTFSYNAQEYCDKRELLPNQWNGGKYERNEKGEVSEIHLSKSRDSSEKKAIEKDVLLLSAFALKGVDLCKVAFTNAPGAPCVNAQEYLDGHYPQYMEWHERELQKQLSDETDF